ncbi:aldo/keto reductase [Anaerofustis stercorihominis]|uniref:Aldo/keto reductase n=1 Tax=Anaerofustis stercorihominis TaxID=214853 RepID=A0A3E3E162_9FIRM|nr:aldo/keto reductase [Anaerofustis stercorihominis]RGD75290.1 aldo/keto reductase [Anaerofustis stercorihominis]
MEKYKLNNGLYIDKIGFGTYKAGNGDYVPTLINAIESGYRHFDTAAFYNNEHLIKEVMFKSNVKREDLFLSSKVWKTEMGYDNTIKSFEKSLNNLGTDYLDMFLIHWPKKDLKSDDWKELDIKTWKALETLYKEGRVKSIGVSNFLPHHLINILDKCDIKPMVDQLEIHPGYIQKAAIDFLKDNDILPQAWSPIGRARVLKEERLMELSKKYNKSVAQICIRFILQLGVQPLPKSSSVERMQENMDVFDFEISIEDEFELMCLPQIGWSGEHPDRERIYFD